MKIGIISNFVYPYKVDATGNIVYLIAKNLVNNNHQVMVFSKYIGISKTNESFFSGIEYHGIRNLSSATFSEYLYLRKNKRFFYRFALDFAYLTTYFLRKIKIIKFNEHKKFVQLIAENAKNDCFDLLVICCGNFNLIEIINKNMLDYKKVILISTDDWSVFTENIKDFEQKISLLFDNIFVFQPIFNNLSVDNNKFNIMSPIVELNVTKTKFNNFSSRPIGGYFGSIYGARDSQKFTDIIQSLSKYFEFIFYTTNIGKIKKVKHKNVKIHNYVYGDELDNAYANVDFLMGLDNFGSYSNFIPSKIYAYMATKKPIILFYYNDFSPALFILSKYDLVLFVNLNRPIDVDSIISFVNETYHKSSLTNLHELYPDSSPNFLASQIIKAID
ncbi:MAG: hypothetical protein RBR50_07560 [Candidatus Izemoplasmatales bacterium]|nr:hypothetical protein [Candidatus Izemoplasmatales bacterium]